jgi:hypothetical protein
VVASCEKLSNVSSDDLITPCLIGVKLYDNRYKGDDNEFEHFVLLLGHEGNKVLVVDPHTTPAEVSRLDSKGICTFWTGARIRLFDSWFEWLSSLLVQRRLFLVVLLAGFLAWGNRRFFLSLFRGKKREMAIVMFIFLLLVAGCKDPAQSGLEVLPEHGDQTQIVVCEPPELKLGALMIRPKMVVPCKLQLRLTGKTPNVAISGIQTSCKCIKIDGEKYVGRSLSEEQPTMEVPFEIEFANQSGDFRQTIQFTFNQDESNSILVPISAFLSNVPNALTNKIVFQSDVSLKTGKATAVFTRARMESDPALALAGVELKTGLAVTVAGQQLVTTPLPNLPDRRLDSLEVTLALVHDLEIGAHSLGELKFFWTSETIPAVELPVELVHEHVLSATPRNVFCRGKVGGKIEGEFKLRGDSEYCHLVERFSATNSLDSLQMSFEAIPSGDGELTVKFKGKSPADAVRVQGEIICEFGAEIPALKIPVRFLFQ